MVLVCDGVLPVRPAANANPLGFLLADRKVAKMAVRQTVKSYDDVISFGKFKGKSFGYIAKVQPSYLCWLNDEKIVDMPEDMVEAALNDSEILDPRLEFGDSFRWDYESPR
jgi:hypothetical protein